MRKITDCEIPQFHSNDEEILSALKTTQKIAVVGLSHKPEKDSYRVAKYLLENGFQVVPVNPIREEILGQRCYKSLLDIPFSVDMADLFLRPEKVPQVVDQAIQKGIKVIWMQIGVVNNQAAEKAQQEGLKVFMNMCIMREHQRLKPFLS